MILTLSRSAKPVLALPRPAKRLVAPELGASLCFLAFLLGIYLRLKILYSCHRPGYFGLRWSEITHVYEAQKSKSISKIKTPSKKSSRAKSHTMKGVKLPAKYKNPANPMQTWTVRGVDPAWVAKLRVNGLIEAALIQVAADAVSSSGSLN